MTTVPTELGNTTKLSGVYDSSAGTFGITGALTLDAQGDPNAVFIFKAASTLTTASASSVNLINAAQACNVFWVVGSSATLGTNSTFRGSILALTSITLTTGATVEGRVLARNGAVTMDSNTITRVTCSVPPGGGGGGGGADTGTITVVKTVFNDNTGTKVAGDFQLFVDGTQVFSDVGQSFAAPATYTVTESADANYVPTFSGDCDSNGTVTLAVGGNALCLITNNDVGVAPVPPPAPPVPPAPLVPTPIPTPTPTPSPAPAPTLPKTGISIARDFVEGVRDALLRPALIVERPVTLRIPRISVIAPIDVMGKTAGGAMEAPRGAQTVGWYGYGPRPGELGSAVIDGHYGPWKNGKKSVFTNLSELSAGDTIFVDNENGTTTTFIVRETRSFTPDADASDVFRSDDGKAHLNLITCEGVWDRNTKSYSKRLVVFADAE